MASNNEYKRYFIILQEDDKGYEISSGKTPTGYVKIEVKNNKVKLNAFIQNVKLDDRIEYRLILVASVKKLAVDIGKIVIDGSGRGELSHEFESDNVLKSGMSISDFNIAAVSAGASAPLSGYTGRDKQEWKGRYEVLNSPKRAEEARKDKKPPVEEIVPGIPEPPAPQLPPEIEIPPAPVVPPQPEMPPAPPEPVIPPEPIKPPVPEEMPPVIVVAPKPEPEVTQIIENKVEIEIVVPKCPSMAPMEEPCEMEEEEEQEEKKKKLKCDDIKEFYCEDEDEDSESESDSDDHEHKHEHKHECEREEEHKHFHEEYHSHAVAPYYSGSMYGRLKKELRRLRRYEPFEEERECDWFRVGDDIYELNQVAVPYMGHMLPLGYPFMSEGCSMLLDRKDYIIGVRYEEKDEDDDRYIKHVLFGVPALYSKRNEQYYKSRGYSEFRPHKSKGYGYFIMCLDIEKGTLCHMG